LVASGAQQGILRQARTTAGNLVGFACCKRIEVIDKAVERLRTLGS